MNKRFVPSNVAEQDISFSGGPKKWRFNHGKSSTILLFMYTNMV